MEKLKQGLKMRLNSAGKVKHKDEQGNDVFVKQDIFAEEMYEAAIETAISALKQFSIGSHFGENEAGFFRTYQDLIVQGATIQLLAGQALLERGREFQFTDNGIAYKPPSVSDVLMTQWQLEYQMYMEKLRLLQPKPFII
jgi:hypothetical protein